ncbi:hypothetical protein CHS0354_042826 [Potamilus streckersoni]|uniref:Uncharacterized protein n=1 Tax=Potamilus streckersoni TaxID=2493646 RepID=A0AAE0W6E1_9BIVA|nr:hypothetical protein CHS0354_042826 [Potamilus streckersoni]
MSKKSKCLALNGLYQVNFIVYRIIVLCLLTRQDQSTTSQDVSIQHGAVGPLDYTIHTFDGHCNPDGTCEYVLKIPAGSAISGVMDNATASAIVAHLSRHDGQILGLMTFFGNQSDNPNMINLLQEISSLKNLEARVQNELDLLVTDIVQLRKDNEMLKQQVLLLNSTLEKEGKREYDLCIIREQMVVSPSPKQFYSVGTEEY